MKPLSPTIRVLIVDDSALVRKLLRDVMSKDPDIEVVGTASNGLEAISAVKELKPDVVTMDINMPEMDGLAALEYIMRKHPLPVVMLSALAQKGARATLMALELGAVDFIAKPSHYPSSVTQVRDEVVLKVKTAAQAKLAALGSKPMRKTRARTASRREGRPEERLVVIGASAGGPKALSLIMPAFPRDLPAAMVVVQHMPGVFTRSFATRLNGISGLQVKEAEDGEALLPGKALVVPGGKDMIITQEDGPPGKVQLMDSQNRAGASPHIDTTMITAAESYGADTVGVILTGMGSDGARGMEKIKRGKGATIAQDEDSCLVFGMPKAAIDRGCIDYVVSLEEIPEKVLELL